MAAVNWEMIGALGESVGAIAVVLSLAYLAKQVAMSNRLAQAEAWRSRFSDLTSLNAAFGVDPRFHRAMVKVHQGALEADLEPDEISLVSAYTISSINVYEQLFREVRDGVLDRRALDEFGGQIVFRFPFCRASWSFSREIFSPAFVEYVERKHQLPLQAESSGPGRTADAR